MNIWIVNHYAIPPSMGGLVRHFYFSKYLQRKNHTVKIFTSSKIHNTDINMIKDKSLYKEVAEQGVEYVFVRSRNYKGNGGDRILNMIDFPFKTWKALKSFFNRNKPDVIYTSSPDLFVAFFALLFGKFHHIPVIVEVRDLWPESIVAYGKIGKRNPLVYILYMLEKWIYKNATYLIFTMPGGGQYIKDKKWKIDQDKIHYINNGVDLEEFQYNKSHYIIEDKDLDTDKFIVVYVGSIRYVNNLKTLVDAAGILKKRGYDDIVIYIYGDGTEKEILEEQCRKEKLNVYFKGRIEKKYIPYVLTKADLNLINVKSATINKYGCSWNKLFEYMASGKPILSNLPVEYDIIKKFGLGEAKVFSNSEEYADALIRFSELDRTEYEKYCENTKKAAQYFDYVKLSDKLEKLLKEAAR